MLTSPSSLSPPARPEPTAGDALSTTREPHLAPQSTAPSSSSLNHSGTRLNTLPAATWLDPSLVTDPAPSGDDASSVLPTPPPHLVAAFPPPPPPPPPLPAAPRPQPTPQDPSAQIAALADLNADADLALVANRHYQAALMRAMTRLERVRDRAAVLKTIVASLAQDLAPTSVGAAAAAEDGDGDADGQAQPQPARATSELRLRAPGMLEPSVPYFKALYGKDLPLNEDAKARERYLAAVQTRSWHAGERKRLKKEVIAQNHRLVAREAMQRGEDPAEALARRKDEDEAWFVRNSDGLDWEAVALVIHRRSPLACKIQWLERDHPNVGRPAAAAAAAKWSRAEKQRLDELVRRFGAESEGTWGEVARELGTGRTPTMCARQWRRRPKARDERTTWTRGDDERLREAVQQWGENWDVVARTTGRAANQCLHRYLHSLRPGTTHGRFSRGEDARIVAAVGAFGTRQWGRVAARVGGRTEAQCRERWAKSLDPRIHVKGSGGWEGEEDDVLVELHEVEGLGWAEIAQRAFNGQRGAAHVARRYEAIQALLDPEGAAEARRRDKEERRRRKVESEPVKKKRGRPRKVPLEEEGEGGTKGRGFKRRKTG